MEINDLLNGLGSQRRDNCNNNGFGGSWIWLILLFVLFGAGGCGTGFGGYGSGVGGYGYAPMGGDTYTCKTTCKKNKCGCGNMMAAPYAGYPQQAGGGFNSWWIIILLVFFCCSGRGNGGFCNDGCNDNNVCV